MPTPIAEFDVRSDLLALDTDKKQLFRTINSCKEHAQNIFNNYVQAKTYLDNPINNATDAQRTKLAEITKPLKSYWEQLFLNYIELLKLDPKDENYLTQINALQVHDAAFNWAVLLPDDFNTRMWPIFQENRANGATDTLIASLKALNRDSTVEAVKPIFDTLYSYLLAPSAENSNNAFPIKIDQMAQLQTAFEPHQKHILSLILERLATVAIREDFEIPTLKQTVFRDFRVMDKLINDILTGPAQAEALVFFVDIRSKRLLIIFETLQQKLAKLDPITTKKSDLDTMKTSWDSQISTLDQPRPHDEDVPVTAQKGIDAMEKRITEIGAAKQKHYEQQTQLLIEAPGDQPIPSEKIAKLRQEISSEDLLPLNGKLALLKTMLDINTSRTKYVEERATRTAAEQRAEAVRKSSDIVITTKAEMDKSWGLREDQFLPDTYNIRIFITSLSNRERYPDLLPEDKKKIIDILGDKLIALVTEIIGQINISIEDWYNECLKKRSVSLYPGLDTQYNILYKWTGTLSGVDELKPNTTLIQLLDGPAQNAVWLHSSMPRFGKDLQERTIDITIDRHIDFAMQRPFRNKPPSEPVKRITVADLAVLYEADLDRSKAFVEKQASFFADTPDAIYSYDKFQQQAEKIRKARLNVESKRTTLHNRSEDALAVTARELHDQDPTTVLHKLAPDSSFAWIADVYSQLAHAASRRENYRMYPPGNLPTQELVVALLTEARANVASLQLEGPLSMTAAKIVLDNAQYLISNHLSRIPREIAINLKETVRETINPLWLQHIQQLKTSGRFQDILVELQDERAQILLGSEQAVDTEVRRFVTEAIESTTKTNDYQQYLILLKTLSDKNMIERETVQQQLSRYVQMVRTSLLTTYKAPLSVTDAYDYGKLFGTRDVSLKTLTDDNGLLMEPNSVGAKENIKQLHGAFAKAITDLENAFPHERKAVRELKQERDVAFQNIIIELSKQIRMDYVQEFVEILRRLVGKEPLSTISQNAVHEIIKYRLDERDTSAEFTHVIKTMVHQFHTLGLTQDFLRTELQNYFTHRAKENDTTQDQIDVTTGIKTRLIPLAQDFIEQNKEDNSIYTAWVKFFTSVGLDKEYVSKAISNPQSLKRRGLRLIGKDKI